MTNYEPCIVSFIDILGFRNLLKTRSAPEIMKMIRALDRFTRPDNDVHGNFKTEARDYSRAFSHSVSDAIVRVRPYNTKYRDGAFIWEILDLLHAHMELINVGVLIRAGVTVGDVCIGANGEGPIFGLGVVRAYEIESEEAVNPRIVIDQHALNEHRADKRLQSEHNGPEEEIAILNRLVVKDADGKCFIDYLAAHDEFDDPGTYLSFLQDHALLIRSGLKANHDKSTHKKYEWLKQYHNRHVSALRGRVLASDENQRLFWEEYETSPEAYFDEIKI